MLYIRLKNGQPFEHPITESNLLLIYPNIDLSNLPDYVAKFIDSSAPQVGIYQVAESYYQLENSLVVKKWIVREMTELEIFIKQEQAKQTSTYKDDQSLIFDPNTCQFIPSVPYPIDGKTYEWNRESSTWVEIIPD